MNKTKILIDTHVLLWILSNSKKLKEIFWIKNYSFYVVSPLSFLEMQYLHECRKISIQVIKVVEQMRKDTRFLIDSPDFEKVFLAAMNLSWTRDPFDRLLVAHSLVQNLPFATCDRVILSHHVLVV